MAPEQGPDSKSQCGKKEPAANEEESGQQYENNKHDNASTSQSLNKDSIGWIYLLRKDQLIEQCQNVGIATTGFTVEYLRKQLAERIRAKRLRASSENLLRELEKEVQSAEKSIVNEEGIVLAVPTMPTRNSLSDTDVIQRWNLKYSGDTDLMDFLERAEELAESYHIPLDRLLPAMLTILYGNALKWYRVKRNTIDTWSKFREEMQKFFLPTRYLSQLEQNFYNRRQKGREHAKEYILTMLTLARQHPQLQKRDHLDRIYNGLRTEYRHYIRRSDFSNLDQLISLTDEFEALGREERPQTSHMISDSIYVRTNRCWRCKRYGHIRSRCTFPFRLFCSYCGKDGVLSRECDCQKNLLATSERTISTVDGRYYISVKIFGKNVQALVDTGSTRTYIGEPIKEHLHKLNIKPLCSEGLVQMADQSLVTHVDTFPIEITYKEKRVRIRTSVIPTLAEPMILGMDFLNALNLEICLDGEVLTRTSNSNVADSLYSLTSRDFLSDKDNYLCKLVGDYKTRSSRVKGLCTNATHEIRLKHKKPMINKPPPDPRPRIVSDIVLRPPSNTNTSATPATCASCPSPRETSIVGNPIPIATTQPKLAAYPVPVKITPQPKQIPIQIKVAAVKAKSSSKPKPKKSSYRQPEKKKKRRIQRFIARKTKPTYQIELFFLPEHRSPK